jgi:predicted alpha/beta-fold hydrolase
MPLVDHSTYKCPPFLTSGHLQTVLATLISRARVVYERERIYTEDNDFLDLDWVRNGSTRLAVLSHGLEGDSKRGYMMGMVRALTSHGWDALAWNARGCSGEPNRVLRFTHSGATEDLHTVIRHIVATYSYSELVLIGFSLGGNLTLKYLGERVPDSRIKAAVAFSVPCDLQCSSNKLAMPENRIYMRRFLMTLREKVLALAQLMPGTIDDSGYSQLRNFKDFDDRYTAPIHGFENAEDYWRKSSCKQFLKSISVPTLLINSRNDPFLADECYPADEAESNPNLHLETPDHGGHVGFISINKAREYWSETRAVRFLNSKDSARMEFRL